MVHKPLQVPCPGCQRLSLYSPANPWRPFCSERCRVADLGAWASESYRVPSVVPLDADGDPTEGEPRH